MVTISPLIEPQPGAPDEEGINLEEIREFAKNFKIRRLSLGLTQTQVGQALTATEGPAYSQSAICRWAPPSCWDELLQEVLLSVHTEFLQMECFSKMSYQHGHNIV